MTQPAVYAANHDRPGSGLGVLIFASVIISILVGAIFALGSMKQEDPTEAIRRHNAHLPARAAGDTGFHDLAKLDTTEISDWRDARCAEYALTTEILLVCEVDGRVYRSVAAR